jgi:hypothetical protein
MLARYDLERNVVPRGKHLAIMHHGQMLIMSVSTSDRRAIKNMEAQIRRLLGIRKPPPSVKPKARKTPKRRKVGYEAAERRNIPAERRFREFDALMRELPYGS